MLLLRCVKGRNLGMMENYLPQIVETQSNIHEMPTQIRQNGLHVGEIKFRYNHTQVLIKVRGESTLMSLSNAYLQKIEEQTIAFKKNIIDLLTEKVNCAFVLTVPVDAQGVFDEERIHIRFKIDVMKEQRDVAAMFREPFRVLLPFADFVTEINIRGHRHRLSIIEGSVTLGVQDIQDVVHNPFVGERVKGQWTHFAYRAHKAAKESYKCDVVIPCFEGELEWDCLGKSMTLQFVEFCEPRS